MMQFSYVSMGARNMRKLGGQFLNGVSYLGDAGRKGARATAATSGAAKNKVSGTGSKKTSSSKAATPTSYSRPNANSRGVKATRRPAEAPEPTSRKTSAQYQATEPTPIKSNVTEKSDRSKKV